MKLFTTELTAIEKTSGYLINYCGPNIPAINFELAQEYCNKYYPYLSITGELIAEIPCKEGSFEPDWDNRIDYETINSN